MSDPVNASVCGNLILCLNAMPSKCLSLLFKSAERATDVSAGDTYQVGCERCQAGAVKVPVVPTPAAYDQF